MGQEELAVERRPSNTGDDGDEDRLAQFGYKQELKRDWGLAHNFGVSFSIIVSDELLSINGCAVSLTPPPERDHRYHHPLLLWPEHRRPSRYVGISPLKRSDRPDC
jgi:hypothetical protein